MKPKWNFLRACFPHIISISLAVLLMLIVLPPSFVMSKTFEPDSTIILDHTLMLPLLVVVITWAVTLLIRSKKEKRHAYIGFTAYLTVAAITFSASIWNLQANKQVYVFGTNFPSIGIAAISIILIIASLPILFSIWRRTSAESSKTKNARKWANLFLVIIILGFSVYYCSEYVSVQPPVYFKPGTDIHDGKPLSHVYANTITTTLPLYPNATYVSTDMLRIVNSDHVSHRIYFSEALPKKDLSYIQFFEANVTIGNAPYSLFRIEQGIFVSTGEVSIPPGEWIISCKAIAIPGIELNQTISFSTWIAID